MIRATGHQLVSLCRSGGGGEESAPGSFNDQLVLRNCSVGLRNSVVSPSVFFVASAWWGFGQAQPGAIRSTFSHCWDNGYKWGRYWHKPALTKGTLKMYLQDEEELHDEWVSSVSCDWSHRRIHKTEWVLLPAMPKRRLSPHPWQFRGLAALSRDPTFCKGSAVPTWGSWVACPWVWWQASDGRGAGEAAWEIFAGFPSCSGQRTPVPRGLDSGFFRKHWPSTSCARQGFVPSRCTPGGR